MYWLMLVSVIFTILLPRRLLGTFCICHWVLLQITSASVIQNSDSYPICSENASLFTSSAILIVNIYSQLITGGCD